MNRLFPDTVYVRHKNETDEQREKRLWKPKRIGEFYCAPRCGCHCTWKAYQLANKRARELCRFLGAGWEPHVWENGGWHYEALKAGAEVHATHSTSGDAHYSVWLQTDVGSVCPDGIKAMMQVITDVPGYGTGNIKETLAKALALKRQAACALLLEAEEVDGLG